MHGRRDRPMRLSRRGVQREESRLLWVGQDDGPPHRYLVAACRQAGELVRELLWAMSEDGQRSFGRVVEFGDRTGQEHPMSVKLVSPRMLLELARAPEDVLVMYELGLVGTGQRLVTQRHGLGRRTARRQRLHP